ncbi:MAG: histidinol dehydrogenase [Acidobacteria bacterium]|nr:MAG: histidinol dehydrogenase [Acidobacteriota bacterium]
MLQIIRSTDRKALDRLLRARQARLEAAEPVARRILDDVRHHGDRALVRYARKFDGVDLRQEGFTVSAREVREACRDAPRSVIAALRVAARNIQAAATRQLPRSWQAANDAGIKLGQLVRPLDRVACYIPGGRFPLPSTVLMSVIPAQVAGVREIVITSPRPAPTVLVAADFLGIKEIFRLGGAQAIAAFAYGTESVARADKIVGPGNRFVAAAKKLVAGECGIDFVAGPTELVVVGSHGRPQWIASDLLAQAEHDPDAVAIFITPSRRLALQVQASLTSVLEEFRSDGAANAKKSLARQGAIILTRDLSDAVDLANTLAPEHLTLTAGASQMLDRVTSAGSIFLGDYSAVAAGDYASGSNHILPTGGAARLRGGLSAADFVKAISVQRLSRHGLARLRRTIATLAAVEGLKAHARSVETRFKSGSGK